MVSLLLQLLICTSMLRYLNASGCEGYFKNCCPGSSWNSETQQCEQCMPGITGVNCSSLCPYPYYGVDCQRKCNCSRNLCNVSTGCIRIVTGVCLLPPDIPNADVTVENNTARYFCNPGYYQLNNTDEFISCDGNIWQSTNFECIRKKM
ncbi:platelet endothelial aggregation receptor 1-like [Crassostrea angulata]|uniref:platelet endothelial aggregation receptor 1-like n=1 Tax=Magallana angulata TaxID=2784310 RepID=UPI0022B10E39|nr:platelet endothelial aggregation receptor 1-like [Crassostrea angulata]